MSGPVTEIASIAFKQFIETSIDIAWIVLYAIMATLTLKGIQVAITAV